MPRKKLNNILSPLGIFALIVFFSCNGNNGGDAEAVRRDTVNNWMTLNISFLPGTTNAARQDYVDYCKQFVTDFVSNSGDSALSRRFSSSINEITKDSLRYSLSVRLDREYPLRDSVSDPRPPCPPIPGPRTISEAELDIQCAPTS